MAGFRKLFMKNLRYRSFGTTQKLRECCEEDSPTKPKRNPCHDQSYKTFRALFLFIALPMVISCSIFQYNIERKERVERLDFVPYEHLRIRTKRFPWGDGNKTFFHNSKVNALPEGYEDELEDKEEEQEE